MLSRRFVKPAYGLRYPLIPEKAPSGLFVAFQARRLPEAKVSWINESWFAGQGLSVHVSSVASALSRSLLRRYAFCVPVDESDAESFADEFKTFYADRYGGPHGMVSHGGSGRVGFDGLFQVKGIGRTPLVPSSADWEHSHGCLWLEEAIREAILAEVVRAEFPHGAVPIVAIIDTGLNYPVPDQGMPIQRRALALRPFAFRPAHFERASVFYKGSVSKNLSLIDSQRVKNVFREASGGEGIPAGRCAVKHLMETIITNAAEQAAFGRTWRIHHEYLSSNLGLGGELLDCGSTRAVPDWVQSFSSKYGYPLGKECRYISDLVRSLTFFASKCGFDVNEVAKKFVDPCAVENCFREVLQGSVFRTNGHPAIPVLISVLIDSFVRQQKFSRHFYAGLEISVNWLYDVAMSAFKGTMLVDIVSNAFSRELEHLFYRKSAGARPFETLGVACDMLRFLQPRVLLAREALQGTIFQIVEDPNYLGGIVEVDSLIWACIARSRRLYAGLPANLIPIRQYVYRGSSLLVCVNSDGLIQAWVQAIFCGGMASLFGDVFSLDSKELLLLGGGEGHIEFLLPGHCVIECAEGLHLTVGGTTAFAPIRAHEFISLGDVRNIWERSARDEHSAVPIFHDK